MQKSNRISTNPEYTYKTYTFYEDSKIEQTGILYTIVSGDKFSDIQNAIDSATPGETIYLKNVTYTNDIGNMVIDKPITIIGTNGTILDAEKKSRIFNINSYNVNLANIEFVNGSAEDGGAIYISDNSNNVKIFNSRFNNNTASNDGGAVFISHDTYAIEFIEVNFTDNEAARGGGAVKSASNGNDLTFENCTFLRNNATGHNQKDHEFGGGGLWCYNGVTYLRKCTFDSNWGNYGGAVRGSVNIKESLFENNVAFNGNGGAIDMTIEGSVKPELYIEDTKFINNTASDLFPAGHVYTDEDAVSQGGAVHIYDIDKVEMYGCELYNNTAKYRGGGLDFYILREGYVANCTFENNTAIVAGGAYIWGDPNKLTEFKCNFTNVTANYNQAHDEAGAFYIKGDNVNFYNVTSNYNNASIGGSTYIEGNNTNIRNSTFDNNLAIYNGSAKSGIGGAVYILGDHAKLSKVISENNVANLGGSTFIHGNDIKVNNSYFDNNNATNGGALNILGDDCVINHISASHNQATENGGAVYVEGDRATFEDVNSINNTADIGGSFYIEGDYATIKNSNISNNTAFSTGGGAYIEGDKCNIINNNITFNRAVDPTGSVYTSGGGLSIQSDSTTVSIIKNNISSNHATDNGGGIYIMDDEGSIIMDQIYAYNNTAENGGFCGVMSCSEIIVTDSTFENNHATGNIFGNPDRGEGGAFNLAFVEDANIQGNFYNNTAMNGSAIYTSLFTMLNVHDSKFIDNQAHSYYLIVVPKNNKTYQLNEDVDVIISHIGGDNVINAIHIADDENDMITLNNVTYPFYNNGIYELRTTNKIDATPVLGYQNSDNGEKLYLDDLEDNQVVYYKVLNDKGDIVAEGSDITDISGSIRFTLKDLPVGNYRILATYDETTYYTEIDDTGSFRIISENNLNVEKIALNKTVIVGDQTIFTIVVNNTGDCSLGNVYVIENVPAGLIYAGYANVTGKWNVKKIDDNKYNFTLVGSLDSVASFNVIFNTTAAGNYTNVVVAGSNLTEEKTAENKTEVLGPDMTVEKIALNKTVIVGDQTIFTIVVNNTGDCSLGNVYVIENVPAGLIYAGYANVTGKWNVKKIDDNKYNFTLVGSLDSVASFNVIFNTTAAGNYTNVVVAGSNLTEEKTAENKTEVKNQLCDLEITKLVNASNVYVNDSVKWTIIVVNNGPATAEDVIVNDTLPNNIVIKSCSHDYELDGRNIIWKFRELKSNDPITITLVTQLLVEGKYDNIVVVNTTTIESSYDNNNANNTTFANPICDLTINKTVNASYVYVNDTVEWTITVINVGPSTAVNVKVKDTLPEGAIIIEYDDSFAGRFYNETRTWEIGELKVNEPVSLVLVTKIIAEGNITNIVVVNTTTTESDYDNNKANNTTVAEPICDLTINKTVNASYICIGDSVEWTITVVNVGPSVAQNVKVNEILPEGVIITKFDDSAAGRFYNKTRIWEIGELKVNEPVSLVLVTKILTEGNITNIVNVNTTTYEPNKSNNEANNTTFANPICDLEINKYVLNNIVYLNETVVWEIVVTNHGPSVARNVVVNDTLPQGLTLIDARPSIGNYSDNIWTIGDLDIDTPVFLVLITQTTKAGNITNIAVVNTTTNETDKSNNIAKNTTEVLPICDLTIIKLVSSKKAFVGEELIWTIKVTNLGPCDAFDVKVLEDIPSSLKLIKASASKGTYDKKTNVWTIGRLASGFSETLVITTEVLSIGNITNPVEVTTTTYDSNKSNNKANNTTEAFPIVDLVVIKTSDKAKYHVNDTICWTITVFNEGPCDAHEVLASDLIPSDVEFISYKSSKGYYDVTSGKWYIGDLSNGESATMYLYCSALKEGIITNEVNVTCNEPDKDLHNNYDNSTVKIVNETIVPPEPENPEVSVRMLETGNPIGYLLVVIIVIFSSFWVQNRKE